MEFTLKLGEVLQLNQTLKLIIEADTKVDALLKFKLLGIMKSVQHYVDNFETIRNEKIMEFGKKTEDGNVQISKDDAETIKKFNDSLSDVINSDVKINIQKLKASDIFNKGVKAEYLMGLYSIIEE